MHFIGEIMWHQFVQIDSIRRLPLNEQIIQYNIYLEDLSAQRMLAQLGAAGGNSPIEPEPEPPTTTNYLITENNNQLITENGDFIILNQ